MADPLPDWELSRDPKKNAQYKRERQEEERQRELAEKAHRAKLAAMQGTLLDRRMRCSASLGILSDELRIRKNNWWNVAVDYTAVYEAAWKSFSNTLSDQEKQSTLMWNLAFTALATCSMGGIAVFVKVAGDKWIKTEAKELIVSGATDAVQAGVGGLMNVAIGELSAKYPADDIPSPLNYKGELEKLLNTVENEMLKWVKDGKEFINKKPLNDFEFYDPQKLDDKIREYLRQKDSEFNPQPFKDPKDKLAMTREVEKSMWAQWCASQLVVARGTVGRFFKGQYLNLGDGIIDKLLAFGFIDGGISGLFGRVGDDEVLKLVHGNAATVQNIMGKAVARGKGFRPRKFG